MTRFLLRLADKGNRGASDSLVRGRMVRLAGIVGVASNMLLAAMKLAVGLLSGSIAIMADSVNNFTDCASSLITLAGFRLAGIPADKEHPYGHARYEYISGLVVSAVVLLVGVEFFKSSLKKIIEPTAIEFSAAVAAVLMASVLVKLWQGAFNRRLGKMTGSGALLATAADSRNDALTTAAVLAGAVATHCTGLMQIDGWMGLLVALFVLRSGVLLVRETLDPLLGTAPNEELVGELYRRVMAYDSVIGVHDLMVHDYGPGRRFATAHVEMPANQDVMRSHDIVDNIERDITRDMNMQLVLHMDPIVTDDPYLDEVRELVLQAVRELDPALSMHDFRMVRGETHTNLIFDVLVPPRYKLSDKQLHAALSERICVPGETTYCVITMDRSYVSTTQKIER